MIRQCLFKLWIYDCEKCFRLVTFMDALIDQIILLLYKSKMHTEQVRHFSTSQLSILF